MTNIEIINKLKTSTFVDQDDESYTLEFLPGLTDSEIDNLKSQFPAQVIPTELREILRETRGWDGFGLERVYFDSIGEFGFTELIPSSITLGHDGFGNCWVLEITPDGKLGPIYYACHDPAVLVLFSETLNEYLNRLYEFYSNADENYLNQIHDHRVFEIWKSTDNVTDINSFRKTNPDLHLFLDTIMGDNWVVADLRKRKISEGFAWGKYGPNQFTRRHPTDPIWVIQQKQKGLLSRLFGK